jgi:prepilin-type N-terminal cleavage/methylation domain-containing protein
MQKRMFKAFTLLELIVVVIVLGILALVAVPAFTGVISNSTGSVVENTAKAIARDANALAAFNSGANANVTDGDDIEDALCETTLADGGWGTSYAAGVAKVSLSKNDGTKTYDISITDGRAVVASSGTHVTAGTTHTCS